VALLLLHETATLVVVASGGAAEAAVKAAAAGQVAAGAVIWADCGMAMLRPATVLLGVTGASVLGTPEGRK